MFIASLTYVKPLEEVEAHLAAHVAFLERYYQAGKFICSGRKNPRTGGIILMRAKDKEEVEQIIAEDPFRRNHIADYEIIEFFPTKYAPDFQGFASEQ